jgi:hypothetical protein
MEHHRQPDCYAIRQCLHYQFTDRIDVGCGLSAAFMHAQFARAADRALHDKSASASWLTVVRNTPHDRVQIVLVVTQSAPEV